jgi:hypothetical protein
MVLDRLLNSLQITNPPTYLTQSFFARRRGRLTSSLIAKEGSPYITRHIKRLGDYTIHTELAPSSIHHELSLTGKGHGRAVQQAPPFAVEACAMSRRTTLEPSNEKAPRNSADLL